eukprot:TRINITY_DN21204_c0_g1_i1.p1 TRINITY_DN21204_c0_g1~~TRINITY_DN21204_c0_g1_i1.p1  ORF type:complete len:174 (+),score=13.53 TRINITY_DN21204_c0_g1_i1:554-1075(+)
MAAAAAAVIIRRKREEGVFSSGGRAPRKNNLDNDPFNLGPPRKAGSKKADNSDPFNCLQKKGHTTRVAEPWTLPGSASHPPRSHTHSSTGGRTDLASSHPVGHHHHHLRGHHLTGSHATQLSGASVTGSQSKGSPTEASGQAGSEVKPVKMAKVVKAVTAARRLWNFRVAAEK